VCCCSLLCVALRFSVLKPSKKLLGGVVSTPCTPFCSICTINSELTYFPMCTLIEWAGVDIPWFLVDGFDTHWISRRFSCGMLHCIALCCCPDCVLLCLAVWCRALQCIAPCCTSLLCVCVQIAMRSSFKIYPTISANLIFFLGKGSRGGVNSQALFELIKERERESEWRRKRKIGWESECVCLRVSSCMGGINSHALFVT